jgi:hypothetical protein
MFSRSWMFSVGTALTREPGFYSRRGLRAGEPPDAHPSGSQDPLADSISRSHLDERETVLLGVGDRDRVDRLGDVRIERPPRDVDALRAEVEDPLVEP